MKAFLIVSNSSPSKNGMLVSVISAFVSIESIGTAEDVVEAVGIIQQRYPNILIFNNRIFEEKGHDYLTSILEAKGSFLMLPKHRQFRDIHRYRFFGRGTERVGPERDRRDTS